jgi:hypothetical protein
MASQIPDPEYIYELVDGAVYQLPGGTVLVVSGTPNQLAGDKPILSGEIILRYGIVTLSPPGEVVIPGLFAAEKGGFLVGREAWDYLQRNFQTHPRADVVGVRPDGSQVQKLLRELDFGVPVRVYAYASHEDVQPVAELIAIGYAEEPVEIPELLSQYLDAVPL